MSARLARSWAAMRLGRFASAAVFLLAGCSLEPEMPSVRVQLVAQNSPAALTVTLSRADLGGETVVQTPAELFFEPGATFSLTLDALPANKEIEAWLLDGSFQTSEGTVTVTVDAAATVTLQLNAGLLYRLAPDGTGDFPSIQQAIAAAADGDIIDLAAGTYTGGANRNLNFQGKAIHLRALAGPAATALDLTGSLDDQGFIFQTGEGAGTVVSGLTVRGAFSQGENGMGAQCVGASPTFLDCVFLKCVTSPGGMAGAVLIDGGSPRFTGCAFDSCAGAFGAGAVWVKAGSAEFLDCTFTANVAVQPNSRGGALQVADGASAVVTGCVFRGNKTRNSGGAIASLGFTDVVDCVFFANEGEDGINSRGGAFFGDGFLESCVFRQNEAAEGGAIYLGGTGIFPPARSPVVTGCTIVQNLASIDGGGLVTDRSENTIDHTIVAFNNGGAGASDPDQATVECCDFFGNVPSNTSGINVGTGNNFSLDPRFCDLMSGDLRLSGSSPCLPANNSGCSATVGSEGAGCP